MEVVVTVVAGGGGGGGEGGRAGGKEEGGGIGARAVRTAPFRNSRSSGSSRIDGSMSCQ